jgi:hypothetical protein
VPPCVSHRVVVVIAVVVVVVVVVGGRGDGRRSRRSRCRCGPCGRGCVVTSLGVVVDPGTPVVDEARGVCRRRVAGHALVGFAATAVCRRPVYARSWSWRKQHRPLCKSQPKEAK